MNLLTNTNRLVLGTVQLGLNYGISNRTGKPKFSDSKIIVKEAFNNGIREFDTAQAYGDSEKILGRIITSLGIREDVRIISKFRPDIDIGNPRAMRNAIASTLANLNIKKLHCIMFHSESVLDHWSSSLSSILESFLTDGVVNHIGISVSSPRMAIKAIKHKLIKVVQVPSNVLDRRFEEKGVFDLADKNSKMIYVRSIFLQGLLMMGHKMLPGKMKFAEKTIRGLENFLNEKQIPRELLLMAYPRGTYKNAKIIFGAETVEQVKANIYTWNTYINESIIKDVQSVFVNIEEKILNPALWPQ